APPLPATSSPLSVAAPAPPSVRPPDRMSAPPVNVSELPAAKVVVPVPVMVPPDQALAAPSSTVTVPAPFRVPPVVRAKLLPAVLPTVRLPPRTFSVPSTSRPATWLLPLLKVTASGLGMTTLSPVVGRRLRSQLAAVAQLPPAALKVIVAGARRSSRSSRH